MLCAEKEVVLQASKDLRSIEWVIPSLKATRILASTVTAGVSQLVEGTYNVKSKLMLVVSRSLEKSPRRREVR